MISGAMNFIIVIKIFLIKVLTFKRFIFYGFPAYLVVAEYAIKFLLSYAPGKSEDLALVGSTSTVAAAGLSLIAPVLIPKPVVLNQSASQAVDLNHVVLVRVGDQKLIYFAYLALLVLPLAWGWALWMAHKDSSDYYMKFISFEFPAPFIIALIIYLIGMVFNEIKEVV